MYLKLVKVHNPDVQYLLCAGLMDSTNAHVCFVANMVALMYLFYDAPHNSLYLQGSIVL